MKIIAVGLALGGLVAPFVARVVVVVVVVGNMLAVVVVVVCVGPRIATATSWPPSPSPPPTTTTVTNPARRHGTISVGPRTRGNVGEDKVKNYDVPSLETKKPFLDKVVRAKVVERAEIPPEQVFSASETASEGSK